MPIPKTFNEKIGESFKKFAEDLLAEHGEPISLTLVVDWAPGVGGPSGWMVSRDKKQSPNVLLGAASQLNRMSVGVAERALEAYHVAKLAVKEKDAAG